MNHRELMPAPRGAGQGVPWLALWLLPVLAAAPDYVDPHSPLSALTGPTTPYLVMIGAPAMRFQEALPPPDLAARPPAGAPPQPSVKPAHEPQSVPAAVSVKPEPAPAGPRPTHSLQPFPPRTRPPRHHRPRYPQSLPSFLTK